jgi:zinc transport system ATP-binding protein
VLEVDHLSVWFDKLRVLTDLSFLVEAGTSLAVIGPNGAGKTVLFRALIGSLPYEGTVKWSSDARLGYVPQKLDLERDVPMTGVDFLRARANLARRSAADLVRTLDLAGVPRETAERPIGTLSGGQFQRLLIAFALLGNPSVLLLDEPTAGVDQPGQRQLNELIAHVQKQQNLTVLFISHELTVVYRYATHVLCLGRGRACFGTPRAILTHELLEDIYGGPVDYHVHEH